MASEDAVHHLFRIQENRRWIFRYASLNKHYPETADTDLATADYQAKPWRCSKQYSSLVNKYQIKSYPSHVPIFLCCISQYWNESKCTFKLIQWMIKLPELLVKNYRVIPLWLSFTFMYICTTNIMKQYVYIFLTFISDLFQISTQFSICSLIVISKLLQFWIRIFSSFHCKIEVISYLMGSKTKLSSEKKNNIRCIMHVLDLRIPASAY